MRGPCRGRGYEWLQHWLHRHAAWPVAAIAERPLLSVNPAFSHPPTAPCRAYGSEGWGFESLPARNPIRHSDLGSTWGRAFSRIDPRFPLDPKACGWAEPDQVRR